MSEKLDRRHVVIGVSGLLATGLAGCLGNDDDDGEGAGNGGESGGLVITDHELDDPGDSPGNYIVEGTAETDESVAFAGVVAAFYDSNGDEKAWRGIDEREDGLEAGETWEFSINPGFTNEDDIDGYEVGITDDEREFDEAQVDGEIP